VFVAEAKEPLTDYPMGETCHFLTHAAQQSRPLFDHIIGAGEQVRGTYYPD